MVWLRIGSLIAAFNIYIFQRYNRFFHLPAEQRYCSLLKCILTCHCLYFFKSHTHPLSTSLFLVYSRREPSTSSMLPTHRKDESTKSHAMATAQSWPHPHPLWSIPSTAGIICNPSFNGRFLKRQRKKGHENLSSRRNTGVVLRFCAADPAGCWGTMHHNL